MHRLGFAILAAAAAATNLACGGPAGTGLPRAKGSTSFACNHLPPNVVHEVLPGASVDRSRSEDDTCTYVSAARAPDWAAVGLTVFVRDRVKERIGFALSARADWNMERVAASDDADVTTLPELGDDARIATAHTGRYATALWIAGGVVYTVRYDVEGASPEQARRDVTRIARGVTAYADGH